MTFERAQNSFRAAVLHEPGTSPIVKAKKPRRDTSVDGLSGKAVPRRDFRRTDMRSADRHRLSEASALVRKGRRKYSVDLINISGDGAMVEGPLNARLWQSVILILGVVGEVECAIRWIRDGRYGLEFAHETRIGCDPAELNELLRNVLTQAPPEETVEDIVADEPAVDATASGSRRAADRHPLIWSGIIQFDHESVVARLRNISADGAQVQSMATCSVGRDVLLDLGNAGALAGTVRWAKGDHIGIAFHDTFDVQQLAKLQPKIAGSAHVKPDYLRDENAATSPWASQWGRLSVAELKRVLFR
jgi:hypothetical protein